MNAPQTLWIDWNDQEDTMPTVVSAMTERSQNAHWFQRVDYAPAARIAALEALVERLQGEDAYIAAFAAGQRSLPTGTFVLQDSPELETLRAERDCLRSALLRLGSNGGSSRKYLDMVLAECASGKFPVKMGAGQ